MKPKVLIATRSFGSTSQKPLEMLVEAGCEMLTADMSVEVTEDRLIDLLAGAVAAIIGVVPMTARVLENASGLKVVSAHGVGIDHIDLDAAFRLGITVTNCPGGSAPSVAELTIGLMIAVARSLPRAEKELKQGGWGRYRGGELGGKNLGLIGLGRIGQAVAKRAIGFEMNVLAYDPYLNTDRELLSGVQLDPLEEVIRAADFLSLHTPLTDATRNLIGWDELQAMKAEAVLINTARGGLVDERALFQALSTGQIAGAGLDVFVDEPPGDNPLLDLDNIVLTPHIGAHTTEAIERVGIMAVNNVIACLQGAEPAFRVR